MEPGIAWLVEEKRIPRRKACIIMFSVIGLIGVGSAFSQEIFGFVDNLCSNILLIFGALIAVLFVGWKMDKTAVREREPVLIWPAAVPTARSAMKVSSVSPER